MCVLYHDPCHFPFEVRWSWDGVLVFSVPSPSGARALPLHPAPAVVPLDPPCGVLFLWLVSSPCSTTAPQPPTVEDEKKERRREGKTKRKRRRKGKTEKKERRREEGRRREGRKRRRSAGGRAAGRGVGAGASVSTARLHIIYATRRAEVEALFAVLTALGLEGAVMAHAKLPVARKRALVDELRAGTVQVRATPPPLPPLPPRAS